MDRHYFTRRVALLTVIAVSGFTLSGCGYVVGSPYGSEIRSVHVPTFSNDAYKASYINDGFRRGMELELTEAVQKQIQLRTPFKLVNDANADTRLTGRLVSTNKRVANQNKYDDPRELDLIIGVEVVWEDIRSGQILAEKTVPLDAHMAQAMVSASFAPEAGQSLTTATYNAVTQMAREIVSMMETPW